MSRNKILKYGDFEYEVLNVSEVDNFVARRVKGESKVVFECVPTRPRLLGTKVEAVIVDEIPCGGYHGFGIEKVIFNCPATIVLWEDGTKTVVKCSDGDVYDEEKGLLLCIAKKAYGNNGRFNDVIRENMPTRKPIGGALKELGRLFKTAFVAHE